MILVACCSFSSFWSHKNHEPGALPSFLPSVPAYQEKTGREHPILPSARHAHGARAGSTCRTRGQSALRVPARPPGGGRSEPGRAGRGDSPRPFLGGCAASGGAEARAERGSGHAGRPLCPARPPARLRGRGGAARGLAARGPRPKPGTIGGGAQSPPCPPPSARAARPAGTWRRGRRSCRARPAFPRRARSQRPSGLRAVPKAGSGVPGRPRAAKSPRPRGELPTRLHTKPTRSAGGAPGPVAPQLLRPGAGSGAHKVWETPTPAHAAPPARPRAGSSWARPLPARGLPHVPPPPPLCSGGALTLAPGRNFPRTEAARPAWLPPLPGRPPASCEASRGPLCAQGRPRRGPGRRPLGPPPARVRARTAAPCRRPTARDPPGPRPRPSGPPRRRSA